MPESHWCSIIIHYRISQSSCYSLGPYSLPNTRIFWNKYFRSHLKYFSSCFEFCKGSVCRQIKASHMTHVPPKWDIITITSRKRARCMQTSSSAKSNQRHTEYRTRSFSQHAPNQVYGYVGRCLVLTHRSFAFGSRWGLKD
jgi:hypothetical protein